MPTQQQPSLIAVLRAFMSITGGCRGSERRPCICSQWQFLGRWLSRGGRLRMNRYLPVASRKTTANRTEGPDAYSPPAPGPFSFTAAVSLDEAVAGTRALLHIWLSARLSLHSLLPSRQDAGQHRRVDAYSQRCMIDYGQGSKTPAGDAYDGGLGDCGGWME
jgi:hypothetical protein